MGASLVRGLLPNQPVPPEKRRYFLIPFLHCSQHMARELARIPQRGLSFCQYPLSQATLAETGSSPAASSQSSHKG